MAGLYGWCRLSDQAMSPPCDGWIGSRPLRPVDWSTKPGLSPLVSSEKTQSTCWVSLPQAKLSPLGSAATSGFSQACLISAWTVVTLAGQAAPPPPAATRAAMSPASSATAPTAIIRQCRRMRRDRAGLARDRPWLISASVRPSGPAAAGAAVALLDGRRHRPPLGRSPASPP